MDHHYIEEQNIPDRYLLGKLPAEERARFEEHFLDCRECLDRLETTEDFRGALRTVAIEEAARSYAQAGLFTQIVQKVRRSPAWQVALFGTILLLLSLPMAFLIKKSGGTRDDLVQVTTPSASPAADLQGQYEQNQKAAEQRRQIEIQFERERQERQRLADELEKLKRPQISAPVFVLSMARSVEGGQPVNQIVLPRSSPRIILSLELEPDPNLKSYRATLLASDNRQVWSARNLHPGSKDSIGLNFKTSLINAGDYLLILEGLTQQGRYVPAAKYPFRTIKE